MMPASRSIRLITALQYLVASVGIMFANKLVLTSYRFPSFTFLTLAQFLTTCMLLLFARTFGYVSFPPPQNLMVQFRAIFPLQILFLISTLCSLGGTKNVSLPVFIMLRRTTVPLTMLLEYCLENKIPSSGVAYSVFLLMFGAIVAVGDARAPIFAACLIMARGVLLFFFHSHCGIRPI